MSALNASFKIRPASMTQSDDELFVDCLASQLSWLPTVGAGDQWKDGHSREKTLEWSRDFMKRSDARTSWGIDWCRAYVAETETETRAAVLILESKAPKYVGHGLAEQDEEDPFLYMTFVVTNRDIAEQSKGSGTALIRFAIDQTRSMGMKRLCLDCWRGNDRKLVQFYERLGFKQLGDFMGNDQWPGCAMELRLQGT